MIDHTGVKVSNPKKSRTFYDKALAPLGYQMMKEIPTQHTGGKVVLGYGVPPKPDFWMAALEAGGKDNGKPGPRAHYHKDYYGAFVLDPDGHNVEAVWHGGPQATR